MGNRSDKWELSLERDLKIAIAEYAPGTEIDAAKRRFKSVGFQKFKSQEFDYGQWYWICKCCNNIMLFRADSSRDAGRELLRYDGKCPVCSSRLDPQDAKRWLEPEWGFVTDRLVRPKQTGTVSPERLYVSDVYFADTGEPDVTVKEFPEIQSAYQARVRSTKNGHGELMVLNFGPYHSGNRKRGFIICPKCGLNCKSLKGEHKNPYSRRSRVGCLLDQGDDRIGFSSIGHKYETDVSWIEFAGTGWGIQDVGLWISLAYAVVNAAAEVLNIESRDIGVTTKPISTIDGQAIILYDDVPGGAGHCKQIADHLGEIIRTARDYLDGCDCPPEDPACYNCLAEYRNSRYHHLLKRGPAKKYLDKLLDAENATPTVWRHVEPGPWRQRLVGDIQNHRGPLTLTASTIDDQPLIGTAKDVFELLGMFSRSNPNHSIVLQLGKIPTVTEDAAGFFRLAGMQSAGVSIKKIIGSPPKHGGLILGTPEKPGKVWRWLFEREFGNKVAGLETARSEREIQAVESFESFVCEDYWFDIQPGTSFHRFRVAADGKKEIFSGDSLGPVFRTAAPKRILLIDPYIASNASGIAACKMFLEGFNRKIPELLLVGYKARQHPQYNDFTNEQQTQELGKYIFKCKIDKFHQYLSVDSKELHDRFIWVEREDGKCFYVFLGYGLACFLPNRDKSSDVIYFEVSMEEFENEWNTWRQKAQ